MDELSEHAKEEISLGISYGAQSIDIPITVEHLLQHKHAVMEDVILLLRKMIQGNVESITGIELSTPSIQNVILSNEDQEEQDGDVIDLEKEEEEENDEIPQPQKKRMKTTTTNHEPPKKKRKRNHDSSSPPMVAAVDSLEKQLDEIATHITKWNPDANYPRREKGRIMYLQLLGNVKALIQHNNNHSSPPSQLQSIIERIRIYWKPVLTATLDISSMEETFLQEVATLTKECRAVPELRNILFSLIQEFKSSCS